MWKKNLPLFVRSQHRDVHKIENMVNFSTGFFILHSMVCTLRRFSVWSGRKFGSLLYDWINFGQNCEHFSSNRIPIPSVRRK